MAACAVSSCSRRFFVRFSTKFCSTAPFNDRIAKRSLCSANIFGGEHPEEFPGEAVRMAPDCNLQKPISVEELPPLEEEVTNVEESAEDFKWVARLLPPESVPPPPKRGSSTMPSGWMPPPDVAPDRPYFVERRRMLDYPVFHEIKLQAQERILIRNVHGDIWAFAKDIQDHLSNKYGRFIAVNVNEYTRVVRVKVKGEPDPMEDVKQFLCDQGF